MIETRGDVIADDGATVRVLGSCMDVTERWERQNVCSESALAAEGYARRDSRRHSGGGPVGKIAAYNQKFLTMWRIPSGLAEKADDQTLLSAILRQLEDPDGFLARVRDLYARPEAESTDIVRFRDGRIFDRYSTAERVGDRVVGREWSFRDITDRERLFDVPCSWPTRVAFSARSTPRRLWKRSPA